MNYLIDLTPKGWKCPVCGRGLAPHISECPCYKEPTISYGDTSAGIVFPGATLTSGDNGWPAYLSRKNTAGNE